MCTYAWGVTPPLPVHSCMHFGWPPILPIVANVVNWCHLSQPKKTYKTLKYRIHWNINFRNTNFLWEEIDDSVGWSKYSGEQH